MKKKSANDVIKKLVEAINDKDLAALDKTFAENCVLEWPQSCERIKGNKNRREIYSRFPSLPTVTPNRIIGSGELWVLEASLNYGNNDIYQSVFIFEIKEDLIYKEIAYWSKPFSAPVWRKPWVENLDF